LTLEAPRKIDHALFGYSEGHRQLASTVRLPSEDMYHLGAASDLASDVSLDPAKSYLTGLPLAESRRYALIRTWAAPEMSRPGCVWSHVLLLDDGILSTQADMLIFFSLFRNPREVDRSFYSEPLLLSAEGASATPSLAPRADLISDIIGSYYSNKSTRLNAAAGADAIEAAIAAVWSQQWPRLRAGFSFRTAQLGSHPRRSTRYDVQVAFSEISDAIVGSDWVDAATDDASAGKVTPLRRFLWRYGRDVKNPRNRFRLLVETYLASIEARNLSMTAATKVFDEFAEEDEGSILKNDILGIHTTTLSICPPVSFFDMLRLLDRQASDDAVDIDEVGRRFEKLSSAEIVDVLNFVLAEGSRLYRLRAPIFKWTVRYANDEVMNAEMSSDLRSRILMQRADLITPHAVSNLQSVDLVRLFASCEATEAKRIILDAAVRRDPGETAPELLNQVPALVAGSAIAAARAGELHTAWHRPIAAFRNKLLDTDLLQHATGLADVMTIARLLNLSRNVFPIGQTSANWASRWRVLERDASEQDVLDIEADLLSSALREASPASWDLIVAVLPELRRSIIERPLDGDAWRTLDRSLPGLGYDNWDLNRRILLALHSLQKWVPPSDGALLTAGLSDAEVHFVFLGPQEEPKRKVGLFWWL
jgi:GTPase-associated protein 1, N-terminal domain type 1